MSLQEIRAGITKGLQVGLVGYAALLGTVALVLGVTAFVVLNSEYGSEAARYISVPSVLRYSILGGAVVFGAPLRVSVMNAGVFEATSPMPLAIALPVLAMWLRGRALRTRVTGWVETVIAAVSAGFGFAGIGALLAALVGGLVEVGSVGVTVGSGAFWVCLLAGSISGLLGMASARLPRVVRAVIRSLVTFVVGGTIAHAAILLVAGEELFDLFLGGGTLRDYLGGGVLLVLHGAAPLWGLSMGSLSSITITATSLEGGSLSVGSGEYLPRWASWALPLATLGVGLLAAIVLARSGAIRNVLGIVLVAGAWGLGGLAIVEVSMIQTRWMDGGRSQAWIAGPSAFTPVMFTLWGAIIGALGLWSRAPDSSDEVVVSAEPLV